MKKIAIIVIYILILASSAHAQKYYIHLSNTSGINNDKYQAELEAAAEDLVLNMPGEVRDNFKVFDWSSYLMQNITDSTYIEFFKLAQKKAASISKYYLLFGKISTTQGVFTYIEVDLVLPTTGRYLCADNSVPGWREWIKDRVKVIVNKKERGLDVDKSILSAIADAKPFLKEIMCSKPMGELESGFEFYRGKSD